MAMQFFSLWAALALTGSVVCTPNVAPNPQILVQTIQAGPVETPAALGEACPNDRLPLEAWLLIVAVLIAALSLAIGVYQNHQKEKWHRIEFLRQTVKEFEQDPEIWKALKILDFEEYRDYEIDLGEKRVSFQATNELLCAALASHQERIGRKQKLDQLTATGKVDPNDLEQYQIESSLRDWFNKLLNGLEHFGYFVESGLFTINEIRPWLLYWIRLIADRDYKRPGASKVYDQLYTYIHDYEFAGVLQLFEQFGYRILPTPYRETDLQKLDDLVDKQQSLQFLGPTESSTPLLPAPVSRLQQASAHLSLIQIALSLAKAAYLIYQDEEYVSEIVQQRWTIAPEHSQYLDKNGRDTQAFLLKTERCMVLAFRGSQEERDWQTNLRFKLSDFAFRSTMEPLDEDSTPPIGMVHSGFQAAWNAVEDQVIRHIRCWNADRPTPLPLLITGHSLGGALAIVAAASLVKRKQFNIQGVYTFGQPRVGDLWFAADIDRALRGKIFRFVNTNDLVPHLPFPYSFWNPLRLYIHLGQMLYFNSRGRLASHPRAIVRTLDALLGLLRNGMKTGLGIIENHRMEFYISNLETALQIEEETMRRLQDMSLTAQRSHSSQPQLLKSTPHNYRNL
jgi:hypothetical protein